MDSLVFKGTPLLETKRLYLRKLVPGDADAIFGYASDPLVTRFMPWETHRSLRDSEAFIRFTMARYTEDLAGDWGIVFKGDDRLIGMVGFSHCDLQNKRGEIGYTLARAYWGQGIMPEAVFRLLAFAFEEMGLNRVESCHFLPNEKSGRVMQKVGMAFEGIAREKIYAKGDYWDVKQYAILYSDWVKRQYSAGEG